MGDVPPPPSRTQWLAWAITGRSVCAYLGRCLCDGLLLALQKRPQLVLQRCHSLLALRPLPRTHPPNTTR